MPWSMRWSGFEACFHMDLDELYQEILLDHFRNPRNREELREDEVLADEENPNCGDRIRLAVELGPDGMVKNIRFDGKGCAISTASASIMTEFARGRRPDELREAADRFAAMMRSEHPFEAGDIEDAEALEGVREFPLRIKCATMAWHALKRALDRCAASE